MPIISDAVCNAPDYYDNQITNTMFCAGYEKGGIDACQVCILFMAFYALSFMCLRLCNVQSWWIVGPS